jgi:uncharacterized oligopeptide transporter (OPT) family protein
VLGGLLGILMMIPLRRAFIVKQHGTLKYPEGTACADVLIVGETGGASAKTVFTGFGLAFLYQFLGGGLKLWKEVVSRPLDWFMGATPALEANPALLGVGYVIGTRISCIMVAGGMLSAFVLVPLIKFFGAGLTAPLAPASMTIASMDADMIRGEYIKIIGAGAVATGGVISLCRALPLIISSILTGLRDMRTSLQGEKEESRRTDRDLPLSFVFFGSLLLVLVIWLFLGFDPQTSSGTWSAVFNLTNLAASVLIVLFGFLFVTVSSRLTGEIGSSSNPISGMTIATLLLTCLIFLAMGWTQPQHRLLALSVAAVVCIASSNGGTTSQDLKTGYLVGATPKWQQWSILVGSVSSALVIGVILLMLNTNNTVYSKKNLPQVTLDMAKLKAESHQQNAMPVGDAQMYYVWHPTEGNAEGVPAGKYLVNDEGRVCYLVDPGINGKLSRRDDGTEVKKFSPPQADLFALITNGILSRKLSWALVLLGVGIAVVMELCHVSSLAFAVGVYLPLSTSMPIFVGGLVRYLVERLGAKNSKDGKEASELESEMSPSSLLATGYIAGGTIAGVVIGFLLMNDSVAKSLGKWQYRETPVTAEAPLMEQCQTLAKSELGDKATPEEINRLAKEAFEINEAQLRRYVRVPNGTSLKLSKDQRGTVPNDITLEEFAKTVLKDADKTSSLFDLNADVLKVPEGLPQNALIKVPQHNTLAMVMFALLAAFMIAVGMGWIMKPKETNAESA